MTQRAKLSAGLVAVALALTVAVVLSTFAGRSFDLPVFGIVWSYIILTPLAVLFSILLGDKRSPWTRVGFVIAAIWLAFVVWTTTMTL